MAAERSSIVLYDNQTDVSTLALLKASSSKSIVNYYENAVIIWKSQPDWPTDRPVKHPAGHAVHKFYDVSVLHHFGRIC